MGAVRDQLKGRSHHQAAHNQLIGDAVTAKIGIDGHRQDSRYQPPMDEIGQRVQGVIWRDIHGLWPILAGFGEPQTAVERAKAGLRSPCHPTSSQALTSVARLLICVETFVPNSVNATTAPATTRAPAIAYSTIVKPSSSFEKPTMKCFIPDTSRNSESRRP